MQKYIAMLLIYKAKLKYASGKRKLRKKATKRIEWRKRKQICKQEELRHSQWQKATNENDKWGKSMTEFPIQMEWREIAK